jgi:hypothetical protein
VTVETAGLKRPIKDGHVAGEDGVAGRCVGVAPFDDAVEEAAQVAQPHAEGGFGWPGFAAVADTAGQVAFEAFDVCAPDLGDRTDVAVVGEVVGQAAGTGRSVAVRRRKPRRPKYCYDALTVLQRVWAASVGSAGNIWPRRWRCSSTGCNAPLEPLPVSQKGPGVMNRPGDHPRPCRLGSPHRRRRRATTLLGRQTGNSYYQSLATSR